MLAASALTLAAALWFSFRFAWWRKSVPATVPRILMYHMVSHPVRGLRFNKMRVSPALFKRQIAWLHQEGWTFCFLSELFRDTATENTKRVVLTFDDGYRDNLLQALPVLKAFQAKASLFPVANRADGYDWSTLKKAGHGEGELGRESKLTDAEITEMLTSGLIEIGGHSLTHANLPVLNAADAWREIAGCKSALESAFGVPAHTFCYPFGLYGAREVELVEKAGFIAAVTTKQGIDVANRFTCSRIKISGTEGMFAFRLRIRTGKRGPG